ncbi:CGNR zinc finger domain-containing protein [Streptomyces sp. GMR22]|uniref:CGNR zinc finger domain-containing protein n=1 Tax=Streptomyces sp. GMR22 TaxID=2759524 RepID=UPI0015FAE1C3|nr:CGNR zinc finger domain-containing protein [Streptomyces sp. GMR22]MBA6436576.1 CGNR zinc finger domain-containing protein [Streptomyces sp. GMR22]
MKRQEAPQPLELVRQFINTFDSERHTDSLETVGLARAWLTNHGFTGELTIVDEFVRQRIVDFREALRSLARANSAPDGRVDQAALRVLEDAIQDSGVHLGFHTDGRPDLAPETDTGIEGVLGRYTAIVGLAAFDGSWRRMKICLAHDCQWAFYDHSKNRSGTWCQMSECGNRSKVRAYRARHAD